MVECTYKELVEEFGFDVTSDQLLLEAADEEESHGSRQRADCTLLLYFCHPLLLCCLFFLKDCPCIDSRLRVF